MRLISTIVEWLGPNLATGCASSIERWFGTANGESRKDCIIFVHGPEQEG